LASVSALEESLPNSSYLTGAQLTAAGPLGSAGIRLTGRAGPWPDALAAAIVVTVMAAASLLAPGLTPSPGAARTACGWPSEAEGSPWRWSPPTIRRSWR
jgi:hypothetical protein